MKIIDISLSLYQGMISYPNNPRIKIKPVRGKRTMHSEIFMGTHTGTHLDAPKHAIKSKIGVDKVALTKLVGPCRVLDMTRVKESIKITDLKKKNVKRGERLLFKTSNSKRGFKQFYSDYVYIDGDAADFLAKKQVSLVALDSLSVKKRGGSDQRPHTSLLKSGCAIIEGVDLDSVSPGKYFLTALPLKLRDADGAPTRVVLIKF
jgi:arylformamidase